jgi:hypothetical protein
LDNKIKPVELNDIQELKKDFVSFKQWEKIDRFEIEQGKKFGKCREKIKDVKKMMEVAFE